MMRIRGIASSQSTNLVKQKKRACVETYPFHCVSQSLESKKERKRGKKRAQSGSRRSQRKEVTGIANPDGREQVQRVEDAGRGVIVV